MIRLIRKSLGVFARLILSPRLIRTLQKPILLPSYYREIAADIEPIMDIKNRPEWMDDEYWAAVLRKYAHILDKGLCSCNFEKGRGRDYYNAAIEAYGLIHSDAVRNDPSVKWATQKIEQYDQVQKSGVGLELSRPLQEVHSAAYGNLVEIIRSRRSIRSFQSHPVDDETLKKIVEVAAWSPSSCNKQTIKVFATNNPELARRSLGTCKGGTCFTEYIPCFLSFCVDLRSYVMPEEAWLPQVDAGLAAQNCCLAANTLGLSLTILTWCQHDAHEDDELRNLFSIPIHHRIVFNAVLGYPSISVETPARKSINSLLILRDTIGGNNNEDSRH